MIRIDQTRIGCTSSGVSVTELSTRLAGGDVPSSAVTVSGVCSSAGGVTPACGVASGSGVVDDCLVATLSTVGELKVLRSRLRQQEE